MSKTEPINTERAKLFVDLDKPSLAGLSYSLRHPETWPPDFVWDYAEFDQCAMALFERLWNTEFERLERKIGSKAACEIFVYAGNARRIDRDAVTPEMVADDIDAYLARECGNRG
jgi:hypothetical protein